MNNNGTKPEKRGIAVLALALMTVTCSPIFSTLFNQDLADALEGDWEGFIRATTHPIYLVVHFQGVGDETKATIDIAGQTEIPLSGLRLHENDVEFELSLGPQTIRFHGSVSEKTRLSGTAATSRREVPFELHKLPSLDPPGDRNQAWRQDLDQVLHRFLEYDRSYSGTALDEAKSLVLRLKADVPKLSDPEIVVALARMTALSGNAHTRVYLLRNRTVLRRYPPRLFRFLEGFFVVRARSELAPLLGCRVRSIGGHPISEVDNRLAQIIPGNDSWRDYKKSYFLTSPEILSGLHLIDQDTALFDFTCAEKTLQQELSPEPLREKNTPTEAWWDLSPESSGRERGWVHALGSGRNNLPRYLRNPGEYY